MAKSIKKLKRKIKRLENAIWKLQNSAMTFGSGEIKSWQELAKIMDEKIWRIETARNGINLSDKRQ